ncbi:MAG: hypothetical protein LBD88_00655 [Candidatus Peribacteria bacterium]|jgi:hypothetical protein|nr:hypothetical protein [Candidatus Peribacteria bacterium]
MSGVSHHEYVLLYTNLKNTKAKVKTVAKIPIDTINPARENAHFKFHHNAFSEKKEVLSIL